MLQDHEWAPGWAPAHVAAFLKTADAAEKDAFSCKGVCQMRGIQAQNAGAHYQPRFPIRSCCGSRPGIRSSPSLPMASLWRSSWNGLTSISSSSIWYCAQMFHRTTTCTRLHFHLFFTTQLRSVGQFLTTLQIGTGILFKKMDHPKHQTPLFRTY